jgi:hypothetical protein
MSAIIAVILTFSIADLMAYLDAFLLLTMTNLDIRKLIRRRLKSLVFIHDIDTTFTLCDVSVLICDGYRLSYYDRLGLLKLAFSFGKLGNCADLFLKDKINNRITTLHNYDEVIDFRPLIDCVRYIHRANSFRFITSVYNGKTTNVTYVRTISRGRGNLGIEVIKFSGPRAVICLSVVDKKFNYRIFSPEADIATTIFNKQVMEDEDKDDFNVIMRALVLSPVD